METIKRPERSLASEPNKEIGKGIGMSELIAELLHGATKTHMTHLKTTSYAAHMALGSFYEELPDLADGIAESWQGVTERLLSFTPVTVTPILTPEDAIEYLRELYSRIDICQSKCHYSEIINDLDLIKTLINSTKYKLIFLK